jgi:hypothetical protein
MSRADLLVDLDKAGTRGDRGIFVRLVESVAAEERGEEPFSAGCDLKRIVSARLEAWQQPFTVKPAEAAAPTERRPDSMSNADRLPRTQLEPRANAGFYFGDPA